MPVSIERNRRAPVVQKPVDRALVYRLQVIDLEKRIEQDLDVAFQIEAVFLNEAKGLGLELSELRRERIEIFEQRRGVRVLAHEHPVRELLAAHRGEGVRGDGAAGE